MYDKLSKESQERKVRLNVVSYNCSEPSTVETLKRIPLNSFGPGTFHAYCLLRQVNDYARGQIENDPTKAHVILNKKVFGGVSPGAGIKPELMLIFEEMQQAIENLEHVNVWLEFVGNKRKINNFNMPAVGSSAKFESKSDIIKPPEHVNEEYISSEDWLKIHGLATKKLELFDVLTEVAFKHCDGVVDVNVPPNSGVGDAVI